MLICSQSFINKDKGSYLLIPKMRARCAIDITVVYMHFCGTEVLWEAALETERDAESRIIYTFHTIF